MKIICLNAPPDSGKTQVQKHLVRCHDNADIESFKNGLTTVTRSFYDVTKDTWDEWYTTEGKEKVRSELNGMSCREALIHVSEHVIKPIFGDQVFGEMLVKRVNKLEKYTDLLIIDDNGFGDELVPLAHEYGANNLFQIRIHREGKSFKKDSRNWVDKHYFQASFDLVNNGTLVDLFRQSEYITNLIVNKF